MSVGHGICVYVTVLSVGHCVCVFVCRCACVRACACVCVCMYVSTSRLDCFNHEGSFCINDLAALIHTGLVQGVGGGVLPHLLAAAK